MEKSGGGAAVCSVYRAQSHTCSLEWLVPLKWPTYKTFILKHYQERGMKLIDLHGLLEQSLILFDHFDDTF